MSDLAHECGMLHKNLTLTGTTIELPAAANLIVLLDERDIASSGGFLTGWDNQGSRGGTFAPANANVAPAVDSETLNSFPLIKCYKDGLNNRESLYHRLASDASANEITFAILIKAVPNANVNYLFGGRVSSGTSNVGFYAQNVSPGWQVYEGYSTADESYGTQFDLSAAWRLVVITYKGNSPDSTQVYVDGNLLGAFDGTLYGAFPLWELRYGHSYGASSSISRGQFPTMMVWDKVLSTEELASLKLFIDTKYGLA